MFMDDCIIFYTATSTTVRNIKQVLDHYYTLSGQLVNYQKLCIQFSNGVSNADKKTISQILQIAVSNKMDKYMGCTGIDKLRKSTEDFNSIRRKLAQKLTGWKAETLSGAGKLFSLSQISQVYPNIL